MATPSSSARYTLYRAVSVAELAEIQGHGEFRLLPTQIQGKWFAETASHAALWGKRFFQWGTGPFAIVAVDVPTDVADGLFRSPNLDGIGPARFADPAQVTLINQSHSGIRELLIIPTGVP